MFVFVPGDEAHPYTHAIGTHLPSECFDGCQTPPKGKSPDTRALGTLENSGRISAQSLCISAHVEGLGPALTEHNDKISDAAPAGLIGQRRHGSCPRYSYFPLGKQPPANIKHNSRHYQPIRTSSRLRVRQVRPKDLIHHAVSVGDMC